MLYTYIIYIYIHMRRLLICPCDQPLPHHTYPTYTHPTSSYIYVHMRRLLICPCDQPLPYLRHVCAASVRLHVCM